MAYAQAQADQIDNAVREARERATRLTLTIWEKRSAGESAHDVEILLVESLLFIHHICERHKMMIASLKDAGEPTSHHSRNGFQDGGGRIQGSGDVD